MTFYIRAKGSNLRGIRDILSYMNGALELHIRRVKMTLQDLPPSIPNPAQIGRKRREREKDGGETRGRNELRTFHKEAAVASPDTHSMGYTLVLDGQTAITHPLAVQLCHKFHNSVR